METWTVVCLSVVLLGGKDSSIGWEQAEEAAHQALAAHEYDRAIELWTSAEKQLEESGASASQRGSVVKWIAEAYRRKGAFDQAKLYGQQRLELAREAGIDTELSKALSFLAGISEELKEFDQAYRLQVESAEVIERVWAPGFIVASAYLQVAELLARRGMHADAEKWYQLALQRLGADRYSDDEAKILDAYAESLAQMGSAEEASAVRSLAAVLRALPPDLSLRLRQSAHQAEILSDR